MKTINRRLINYSVFDGESDIFNTDVLGQFDGTSLKEVLDDAHLEGSHVFVFVAKHKEGVLETLHSNIYRSVKRVLSSCH